MLLQKRNNLAVIVKNALIPIGAPFFTLILVADNITQRISPQSTMSPRNTQTMKRTRG